MKKTLRVLTLLLATCLFASVALADVVNTAADIVFVVDESGSMSTEHAWLDGMVASLDSKLTAAGVTSTTYSLIGYGNSNIVPHTLLNAGTTSEFYAATDNLVVWGGTEDGYDAIDYGFSELTFQANAVKNFILITDEDRDIYDSSVTYNTLKTLFTGANGGLLNTVVNLDMKNNSNPNRLIGSSFSNGYLADGSGGFTLTDAATAFNGYGTTKSDYYDLALATEGAAWDLNLLRAGGDEAVSFTNAFIDVKVKEIQQYDPPTVPEPSTWVLMGMGLVGLFIYRKKRTS